PAGGSVTYPHFPSASSPGTHATSQAVSVNLDGSVPDSSATSALATGSYGFQASYSGDTDYTGSAGSCETFSVTAASSTTGTQVIDESTGLDWSNNELPGASAHDTAGIGGQRGGI